MKNAFAFVLILLVATAVSAQTPAPEMKADVDVNFFKLPPDLHFGETSGVAVNSKGHVFVFSRGNTNGPAYGASAAQLLEFDRNGKFIREIGKNLYPWSYAHVVREDKEDTIGAVEKGSSVGSRSTPEGGVLMLFGGKKDAWNEPVRWTRVNPPRPAVD